MRAKLIMFSIMTACTLGSCESILEIDPISEITMANYWKSESDVKGYLNGLYSDYRGMTSTTLYGEDRGDCKAQRRSGFRPHPPAHQEGGCYHPPRCS